MTTRSGTTLLLVFSVFFSLLAMALSTPGCAFDEPDRTVNRSVTGLLPPPPDWLFRKPDHYEFSPLVSNSDPMTQHPAQWDGQDWDPSQWGPQWTPEIALEKFFRARIFEKQYMGVTTPVVELGPTFYKLSDLDQRRTLKLLTDQMAFFKKGYSAVQLVDWSTHDVVGAYTAKGMFLN